MLLLWKVFIYSYTESFDGEGGGVKSYEFGCVCVPVSGMHANAGDFSCLHTNIDECI